MAIFAVLSVLWLPSIFIPNRVEIDEEGFTLKTFWKGKKRHQWNDIEQIWITRPFWAEQHVAWRYKKNDGSLKRRLYDRDHTLPSNTMWSVPNEEILRILNLWLGRHRRAKKREQR